MKVSCTASFTSSASPRMRQASWATRLSVAIMMSSNASVSPALTARIVASSRRLSSGSVTKASAVTHIPLLASAEIVTIGAHENADFGTPAVRVDTGGTDQPVLHREHPSPAGAAVRQD